MVWIIVCDVSDKDSWYYRGTFWITDRRRATRYTDRAVAESGLRLAKESIGPMRAPQCKIVAAEIEPGTVSG